VGHGLPVGLSGPFLACIDEGIGFGNFNYVISSGYRIGVIYGVIML
jgi:hypothetical protein